MVSCCFSMHPCWHGVSQALGVENAAKAMQLRKR
jgi:hypothetical protein